MCVCVCTRICFVFCAFINCGNFIVEIGCGILTIKCIPFPPSSVGHTLQSPIYPVILFLCGVFRLIFLPFYFIFFFYFFFPHFLLFDCIHIENYVLLPAFLSIHKCTQMCVCVCAFFFLLFRKRYSLGPISRSQCNGT